MQVPASKSRNFVPHYWLDPANFLLIFTLPIFIASGFVASSVVEASGSRYFLTPWLILLGATVVVTLALGSKIGAATAARRGLQDTVSFDMRRYDQALLVFLAITLAAHVIFLMLIVSDPALVAAVLTGEQGASFAARKTLVRIPGVTTLTHLSNLVYCMSAVRFVFLGKFGPNRLVPVLLPFLALLVVAHALLGSERLVVVENGAAFFLPIFSFHPRLRRIAAIAPVAGGTAVFVLFAFGEYTRVWGSRFQLYNSFWDFVIERLLSYVTIAANTGAGLITTMPPAGPYATAVSLVRTPILGDAATYANTFYEKYGTNEFNNPSGIFAPVIDYGAAVGLLYAFFFGILIGWVYGGYRKAAPLCLMLFPIAFVGLVDFTQIWYWGGPRLLAQMPFLVLLAAYAIRRRPVPISNGALSAGEQRVLT